MIQDTSTTDNLDNVGEVIKFNDQFHKVTLFLLNGTSNALYIPVGIIHELIIMDDIYSIFKTGKLTFDNTGNVLENFIRYDIDSVAGNMYNFNVDNKDILLCSIIPCDESGDSSLFPRWKYGIDISFIIGAESEDHTGGVTKRKVWHLVDAREQTLNESNVQWSTTMVKLSGTEKLDLTQAGTKFRSAKTGTAIKHLLQTVLPDSLATFTPDWDEGGTEIFYSSPQQSAAFDDLEYLLDSHVSSDMNRDNCLLTTDNDGFSLTSISKYFEGGYSESGEGRYFMDAFSISTGNIADLTYADDYMSNDCPGHNIPSGIFDMVDGIGSYTLLHSDNISGSRSLVTTHTHTYNHSRKQFSIDCMDNQIYNIKLTAQELYADKLPGTDNKHASIITPINRYKLDNSIINHTFSGGSERAQRLKQGRNKVLHDIITGAPGIDFDVDGWTHRRTGRFILVASPNIHKRSPITKLLVGEWFSTRVVHNFLFHKGVFQQSVTCIKPHTSGRITDKKYTIEEETKTGHYVSKEVY